eukprot:2782696-Rhodomonas_salina.2
MIRNFDVFTKIYLKDWQRFLNLLAGVPPKIGGSAAKNSPAARGGDCGAGDEVTMPKKRLPILRAYLHDEVEEARLAASNPRPDVEPDDLLSSRLFGGKSSETRFAVVLLVLLILATENSLFNPFILDDNTKVRDNPDIRLICPAACRAISGTYTARHQIPCDAPAHACVSLLR